MLVQHPEYTQAGSHSIRLIYPQPGQKVVLSGDERECRVHVSVDNPKLQRITISVSLDGGLPSSVTRENEDIEVTFFLIEIADGDHQLEIGSIASDGSVHSIAFSFSALLPSVTAVSAEPFPLFAPDSILLSYQVSGGLLSCSQHYFLHFFQVRVCFIEGHISFSCVHQITTFFARRGTTWRQQYLWMATMQAHQTTRYAPSFPCLVATCPRHLFAPPFVWTRSGPCQMCVGDGTCTRWQVT